MNTLKRGFVGLIAGLFLIVVVGSIGWAGSTTTSQKTRSQTISVQLAGEAKKTPSKVRSSSDNPSPPKSITKSSPKASQLRPGQYTARVNYGRSNQNKKTPPKKETEIILFQR